MTLIELSDRVRDFIRAQMREDRDFKPGWWRIAMCQADHDDLKRDFEPHLEPYDVLAPAASISRYSGIDIVIDDNLAPGDLRARREVRL